MENRFESLSYPSDEQVSQKGHVASPDMKMQNIKLQCQLRFLQEELLNLDQVMKTQKQTLKTQKNVLSLLSLHIIIRYLKKMR